MIEIIKPIPHSHLHNYDDDVLKGLVKVWQEAKANQTVHAQLCRDLVDEVYKVLGYRCALEYVKQYGDE